MTPGTPTACKLLAAGQPLRRAPSRPGASAIVRVLVHATMARHGAEMTRYDFHKGAYKSALTTALFLLEEFPDAVDVAIEILNKDAEAVTSGRINKHLAAEAAQLATQLRTNFRKGPLYFYDEVLPIHLESHKTLSRLNVSHTS